MIRQCWAPLGLVFLRRFQEDDRGGESMAAALLGGGRKGKRGSVQQARVGGRKERAGQ